ncbi:Ig-like domain-containing protein [Dokdonia sp. Asnod3-C12]|uniref:Ig-like domain-containing protein n=1 Tax=Dokdonia sp. Asnod3-C12 TaxID=3160575 RepID=UPI0038663D58
MVKKLQITSVTKNTVRVFALAGSFVKTRFDLGAKMVLAIVCVFGFNFTALSQNGGMPANFEIDGGVYSGTIGAGIDDWFQGSSGFGLIDTSDAAAYLNITQGNLNQPFVVGSNFNQYEVINGSLLYEAIFIRDYVNLNSIGGGLDRTTFGGGQKNADNPVTAWSFNSSSVGEKNDIVDSYIHLRRGGNSIDSSLWIDLGVSCMSSSGNHFIDFELFKSQIEVAGNGFVNSGPDQGHTSWVFDAAGNVISTGDIVIGFSYTSETVNEVLARIWVKRTDFSNINPVNFDWGVNFDGDWNGYGYAEVVIPDGLTIFEDLSGASTPAPPWGTFNDNTNSPFSTVYTSGNLAELGVDLTALGVDPRLAKGGDACESPWTKVIVKSRTSTSFTSQLKDFSGPYDFLEPPVFDTSIKDPGIFNCKASLELSPENPNDSAYFTWTTTDGEFIDGTMSASGAIVEIVKPGFYTLSASPFPGCEATSTTIYVDGGPCAEDDTRTVFFDLPLNIDVVANDDYGNNGPSLTEPIIITQNPSNGVVEINDNNTPDDLSDDTIIYTPNPGYTGFDQFNYKIIDANGHESETTVYLSVSDVFIVPPGERGCDCAPFYENSNFANPTLIGGVALSEGAKYRFPNIFPNNVHGTSIDAIVEIVAFINGATLLDIDVANEGLPRAFQPKINSTNNGDQSVKFDISFVASGTMTPVDISFFGSPFDIDGDSRVTREYAELSLPDSYYTSGNTLIEIIDTGESIRGTAINPITAPGGAISQDPRFTFSNYWEGKNKLSYTIGKQNGNFDRFYALVLDNAEYVNPESTILSAPVICGNVSDEGGDPLTNVEVDIIGSDGSTGTVATDINGDYRYATSIPSAMVDVTYVVIENDNSGYVSISDVDGANDNRITRVINLMSTCGNDFVDDGRPDAVDDSTSVLPLETVTIDVLLNDTFGPDLAATGAITITTQPSQGTAVVNTNGTPNDPTDDFIEFTAPLIDATDLQFAYQICDSDNDCDVATVTVTVNPLIDTIAVDDIENTFINTTVVGNVLTNDFDAQGDIQSVSSLVVTTVQGITVNIDASGSYSYTPPADFVGEDSFIYTVCDNGSPQACDTATVFIEVLPIPTSKNDPPVANADTGVTEINTPVEGSVLSNDFDPDGDPITVTANTDPSNGVLVMNPDGTYEYTPNTDFVGEDTFTYTICDNGNPAACDTATVTIQVIPDFANITVANDDAYLGTIDTDVLGSVLDNDTDPEGDAQTASLATDPSNGSVILNADGTFTYTPDSGYTGPDEFTYTVTDAQGAKDTATVSLVIAPVSNTTTAIDDINNTYVNTAVTGNVLTNDDDAEGDIQTVSSNTDPSNGVLVMNPDGTYEYTPNTDFVGEDTFTYTVCDDGNPQACDTAIVYLEVLPEPTSKNDPPVANADTGVTEINTPVEGSVLSNDFDPDGDPITVTANTDPSNGVLVMNPDGTYEYTPNTDFVGEDTFTYTICDNGSPAACDTATVTIQVIPDKYCNYRSNGSCNWRTY